MIRFSPQTSGCLYIVTAAVLWSLIGPFSKACIAEGILPLETAFWRALLGGICFTALTAARGGLRIPARDAGIFCLFGIWGVAVFFAALQISIQQSGAAVAMVLLYTAPIWVALFSRFLFLERLSRHKLLAIATALAGTVLVCFSGGSLDAAPSVVGILCGLLSGLCFASHFPFYVWWNKRYPTSTIYAFMLLGGCAALLPFVDFAPARSGQAWANLISLGVITNFVAYLATGRGLQLISQVRAAVIGNIEPALAALWVWLFWQENFTASGWAGSALIIGAVVVLSMERDPGEGTAGHKAA